MLLHNNWQYSTTAATNQQKGLAGIAATDTARAPGGRYEHRTVQHSRRQPALHHYSRGYPLTSASTSPGHILCVQWCSAVKWITPPLYSGWLCEVKKCRRANTSREAARLPATMPATEITAVVATRIRSNSHSTQYTSHRNGEMRK